MKNLNKWFYSIRPKTLIVSMASVIMPTALAFNYTDVQWLPAIICLLFAMIAQATSNLVNDYADFKTGCDNTNSIRPDRKLVSGEITPKAMLTAIIIMSTLASLVGLCLIYWGGWILLPFGLIIIAAAFSYSMGPFPLSYNALGDVAVILFYGIIPSLFTFFILTEEITIEIIIAGFAMGLIINELLIVNNYRDEKEDAAHNKLTTVGLFGSRFMKKIFLINPLIACALGYFFMRDVCSYLVWSIAILPTIIFSIRLHKKLCIYQGKKLNELLGKASFEALLFACTVVIASLF